MPEELAIMDIGTALDLLEDYTLNKPIARSQNYRLFQNALDNKMKMSSLVIDRLLAVCVHDLQEDKQYSLTILKIINSILKRIKDGDITQLTNLLPTILEVLNIIKTIAFLSKMETLQVLSFETVISYPVDILIQLVTLHAEEVIEVLNLYCHEKIALEIRCLPCRLVLKILQVLSKEDKINFLKTGLKVLFTRLIPTIVLCLQNETLSSKPLETLEALTEGFVLFDYSKDVHWHCTLECIYNRQKYPLVMKNMLEKGSKTWHRLWIVFIRLLKNDITRIMNTGASPINSILPVVETAFKMDVTNRCRAFQCWTVLIDNFCMETNEANIVKTVKLLIVPLKSSNAKVEETALAKLDTWWHLIRSFLTRINKFTDAIVIPFLHFCFGKHALQNKQPFVPCLLTENTKKRAVEAFIEIAGHLNCSGCVEFPNLNERIITKKVLVDYWNDWVFSLKVAISLSIEDIGITPQQITCAWKSFVLIVCELPDNNIRKDLFQELLSLLETMTQYGPSNKYRTVVIFNFVMSLFRDDRIKALLKSKGEQDEPMHKLISLLMRPSLSVYFRSQPIKEVISELKLITNYAVDATVCIPDCLIKWMFSNFSQDSLIFFWTALAETLLDQQSQNDFDFVHIILWPIKSHSSFVDVTYPSCVWHKLFESSYSKLSIVDKKNIYTALWNSEMTKSNLLFKIYGALVILNHPLIHDGDYEKTVELLAEFMNRVEQYKQIESVSKLLTDTLANVFNKILLMDKIKLGMNVMRCVKNIIKLIIQELQEIPDLDSHASTLEFLLVQIDTFMRPSTKMQQSCTIVITKELVKLSSILNNHETLKKCLLSTLNTCLQNINDGNAANKEIKSAINNLEARDKVSNADEKLQTENNFTTPSVKAITRKGKKKEASIVNTVVENGEEFIVVKSNWKFNPRKLTENQKEKFERKREDIPALYQDLSQSQDEFKLQTWKTDSQDSSSTTSKSTSVSKSSNVEDVSNILKNIPSSDVVPKIIENIFSENTKKDSIEDNSVKASTVSSETFKSLSSPKDVKSPRMALKDRVFRNVRNLIEKSGLKKDDKSECLTQIENIPKTPLSKINDPANVINSAPSKISAERPSRVKRKPKKFDDTQLFALKRNRRCISLSDSQPETLSQSVEDNLSQNVEPVPEKHVIDEDRCNKTDNVASDTKLSNVTLGNIVEVNHMVVEDNSEKVVEIALPTESPENNEMEVGHPINEIKTDENKSIPKDLAPVTIAHSVSNLKNTEAVFESEITKPNKEAVTAKDKMSSNDAVETPKSTKKTENTNQKYSVKKRGVKKSRIEKELAIDTVEGHPFLKQNMERRVPRKNVTNLSNNSRRKSLTEKLNKSKSDTTTPAKTYTLKKRGKDRTSDESILSGEIVTVEFKSQTNSDISEDFPLSEDIIESSQDSTITATSTKVLNKIPKVVVEKWKRPLMAIKTDDKVTGKQSVQKYMELVNGSSSPKKSDVFDKADDSDFPQNKTASQPSVLDSTENMDTEPINNEAIESKESSNDVIIINDDEEPPIVIITEDTCVGTETQEIAQADTQPTDPNEFVDNEIAQNVSKEKDHNLNDVQQSSKYKTCQEEVNTANDTTKTICESIDITNAEDDDNTVSSPFKDEEQRKKDFLDNTLEISPIKTMSPVREKKSPSPETSSDYVVIKLSSPVHSNGEPFEKGDSPEIFTEEKISPDKRDLSPPREDANVNNNSSPSSCLSLKKNKPQPRSGRRAAQMLGLCVPDRLQTIINNERTEMEVPKRVSPSNTPARRNLRILYSSVADNSENSEENEDSENFLKFKKSLPSSDSSPAGPILKRKLAEITDEATVTPVSKRKRVSFHDPPVSTTVSVHKYIEPCGIRSPQNSSLKRLERQNIRSQTVLKSPKRLDNVFKLDSVLTKAVESFTELDRTDTEDMQSMSLDETPAVEIIKNSDLNNVDPLCPELIDCTDPIDVIASDLSSPTMKVAFMKELEGKLATVGDLAKMTELEVNRLCIKAPKVKIAKKVLSVYALKKSFEQTGPKEVTVVVVDDNITSAVDSKMDIETQTVDVVSKDTEMQTVATVLTTVSVQTDKSKTRHIIVQTDESGSKSTENLIASCLAEKPDFIEVLNHKLDEYSKGRIADTLSFEALNDAFMKKVDTQDKNAQLSFLQNHFCERFSNSDLILFCSELLAKIHARPS